MLKCTGKVKISYMRKLADTGKTFVIGGYCWDKDDHYQLNIGFTAWGDTAKIINSYAEKGSVLVVHDAPLKNSNPFDKTKTDENKEREIILNSYSLDEIQQYNEETKTYLTVWKSDGAPVETKKPYKPREQQQPAKQETLVVLEDDLPF